MPDIRTEITEIVTGIGMTGAPSLDAGLAARSASLQNVTAGHWDRLDEAHAADTHAALFATAFANGRAFLESSDALRGRPPRIIEWKGPHNPPGYEAIPADLRIDHVYLVSCKHQSNILANSSPINLFDRRLADRAAGAGEPWYQMVSPVEYEHFYQCVRWFLGQARLARSVNLLTHSDLQRIRAECRSRWPTQLREHWAEFSLAIATASALRWRSQLPTLSRREEMLWRLLRLSPAPYFIMGDSAAGILRLRVATPWDWRRSFALEDFEITATPAGQPRVDWSARVTNRADDSHLRIDGHIEVRWAHGRFSSVEAKIYLDTPHSDVAGYFPLAPPLDVGGS